jgi:hypothetical protein
VTKKFRLLALIKKFVFEDMKLDVAGRVNVIELAARIRLAATGTPPL